MRRKYIFLLSVLFFILSPFIVFADEAKLISFSGNVEVKISKDKDWTAVTERVEILEGGAVKTGVDGMAVILFPNKSKVWLKESGNLEIELRQPSSNKLSLSQGEAKVRIPHLSRKETFEVKTRTVVCAARGTEYTLSTAESGDSNMMALFGEITVEFLLKVMKSIKIPQGNSFAVDETGEKVKVALLTKEEEEKGLENWDPGLTPEDRQKELQEKEKDREQIRDLSSAIAGSEDAVRTLLVSVRESDIEAGRTLKDIHGNILRVDQRLMRPDEKSLQFFNLVKRPEYRYTTHEFAYNGPTTVSNRLDLFQANIAFNQTIPDRIEDWPGFFGNASVKPDKASLVSANRTDANNIFVIAKIFKYDSTEDKLVNDIRVIKDAASDSKDVLITGKTNLAGLNNIIKVNVSDAGANDGTTNISGIYWASKVEACSSSGCTDHFEIKGEPSLYNYRADPYRLGNNSANDIIWNATEDYIINNSGSIRQVTDFTSTSSDPFSIMKNAAAESIMYVKNSINDNPNLWTSNNAVRNDISDTDFLSINTNIDIVLIPDLAVGLIQRALPALSEMRLKGGE